MQPSLPTPEMKYSPLLAKRPSVLLIDSDVQRQFGRAADLRMRGVTVTCAETGAAAYAIFDSALFQLVLIDFRGADSDIRGFYQYLRALPSRQRIGLYNSTSPFILRSARGIEAPPDAPAGPSRHGLRLVFNHAMQRDPSAGTLSEAVRRIAALPPRAAAERQAMPPVPRRLLPGPPQESAASIAERVLGGGN